MSIAISRQVPPLYINTHNSIEIETQITQEQDQELPKQQEIHLQNKSGGQKAEDTSSQESTHLDRKNSKQENQKQPRRKCLLIPDCLMRSCCRRCSTRKSYQNNEKQIVNLKKTNWKYMILFLATMFQYASYYCEQAPAPVQNEILLEYDISNVQYNMFFAADFPNIVLCFVTGYLINDKLLGLRKSIIIFTAVIVVGQLLLTISAQLDHYVMAIIARVLLGAGLECQNVTFYALISIWFVEQEQGLAFSFSAMMMRMGMVSSEFLSPIVLQSRGDLVYPFGLGMIFTLVGLICATLVVGIDYSNQKRVNRQLRRQDTLVIRYQEEHAHHDNDPTTIEMIKSFGGAFWLLTFLVMMSYSTFTPFFANISMLLRYNHSFSLVEAGKMMALPSFIVTLSCPLIGYISDKINKRGWALAFAMLLSSTTQVYIYMLPLSDKGLHVLAPLTLNQFGYAIFISNVWPALTVFLQRSTPIGQKLNSNRQNMAIGIISSAINLGYGITALVVGAILDGHMNEETQLIDYEQGFKKVHTLMCVCDAIACISFFIWCLFWPKLLNTVKEDLEQKEKVVQKDFDNIKEAHLQEQEKDQNIQFRQLAQNTEQCLQQTNQSNQDAGQPVNLKNITDKSGLQRTLSSIPLTRISVVTNAENSQITGAIAQNEQQDEFEVFNN